MPACHARVTVRADSLDDRRKHEAAVLTAYGCAIS
jgi:hypothetical protein